MYGLLILLGIGSTLLAIIVTGLLVGYRRAIRIAARVDTTPRATPQFVSWLLQELKRTRHYELTALRTWLHDDGCERIVARLEADERQELIHQPFIEHGSKYPVPLVTLLLVAQQYFIAERSRSSKKTWHLRFSRLGLSQTPRLDQLAWEKLVSHNPGFDTLAVEDEEDASDDEA